MIRAWIGLALLAGSWLVGLSYYHAADMVLWAILVVAGTALMTTAVKVQPPRGLALPAILMLAPAALVAPWPYRMAILLVMLGLALQAAAIPRRWPRAVGNSAITAGTVLLAQALTIQAYQWLSSCSHGLPAPLAGLLSGVMTMAGAISGSTDSSVAIHSMRQIHRFAATWELLLDPVTACFVAGAVVLLALTGRDVSAGKPWRRMTKSVGILLICAAVWLPPRAGLLMAIYMHRALVTDYDSKLELMGPFWNPWVHLALLAPLLLLAWRFVAPACAADQAPTGHVVPEPVQAGRRWRKVAACALAAAAVAMSTIAIFWDNYGQRKGGRVFVDEFHSTWEPTDRPMDTTWYGQPAGYNYACIYDYLSRFYEMSRLKAPINDGVLSKCDVLMLKVPTSAYAPDERAAIRRFVEDGGGVMLIGEHTDVFGTGRNLNEVGRMFGFEFDYDCLFGIDSFFDETWTPPLVRHPIAAWMPPLEFAVSCSIKPSGPGQAVIRSTGLKSMHADYHVRNFYPQAEDSPEMRYGSFVQAWATKCGKGRVAAFTDSTQFSNFCTFEPGKPELMLGMVEWLNRVGRDSFRLPMLLGSLVLLVLALLAARPVAVIWPVLIAAGTLGWAGATIGMQQAQSRLVQPPAALRPMTMVMMDRTVSTVWFPKSGFISGRNDGFGVFERWILRLGYFTRRAAGPDVLSGDLAVFIDANQPVTKDFRDAVARYVQAGGKVLVLDGPENSESTTNSLLWPYGLSVRHDMPTLRGPLVVPPQWPRPTSLSACQVSGGTPFIHIGEKPVATMARYGKGSVTVVAFSSLFNDANMGVTGDVIPDVAMKARYELEFALLRAIVRGSAASRPATASSPSDGGPASLGPSLFSSSGVP